MHDDAAHDDEAPTTQTTAAVASAKSTASRREILTALAVCGCCMTLGASVADAEPGAAPDDRLPPPKAGRSEVGAVADFAKDGIYDKHARTKQLFVVRSGDSLHAMSSVCTHKRCIIKKREGEEMLRCPCHQAQFDKDGIVAKPPAKVSLAHFAIEIADGKVFVDTSKAFEEKDWSDPAAVAKIGAAAPATKPA